MLTVDLLTKLSKECGGRPSSAVVRGIVDNQHFLEAAGIDTPARLAEWAAQACVETNYFGTLKELGGARYFARYDGRRDLGNTQPGDGARFPGRGVFQITGRDNYARYGKRIGVDLIKKPELAERPDISVQTSALYWNDKQLSPYADKGDTKAISRAINRGNAKAKSAANHEAERVRCAKVARSVLGAGAVRMGLMAVDDEPRVDNDSEASDKAVVENVQYTDEHRVTLVQTWLRNLGYPEVGQPNGSIGPFTQGAIRDYRADKGLPAGDFIDDQLMLALATDTEPRKLPTSRTDATSAEVRDKVPEVKANFLSKIWAFIIGIPGAIIAFFKGVFDNFPDAREYLYPVQEFLTDIPAWAWALGAVGIAVALYTTSRRGEMAGEQAFKDGSRR